MGHPNAAFIFGGEPRDHDWLAGGRFAYTLTPQYQEKKAEREKVDAELRKLLRELERLSDR
jgi:hypothetical protein